MEMQQTLNRMTVETVQRLDSAVAVLARRGLPKSRAALVREAVVEWLEAFEEEYDQPDDACEGGSA